MSKPRPVALDLCSGRGGWTVALLAAGFEVVGVDIQRFKDYPAGAKFLWADVCALAMALEQSSNPRSLIPEFRRLRVVVASPVCTEYSRLDQPGLFPNDTAENVDTRLWLACERIAGELGVPLVLENVRGAQKVHGTAAAHYGSFYLWGNGVPALMPSVPGRHGRPSLKWHKRSPSLRAKIPIELAQHIARHHYGLCVRRSELTRVSNAVLDRTQRLATVNGTERLTEGPARIREYGPDEYRVPRRCDSGDCDCQLLPELEQQSPVPREARNAEETETGCAMQPSRRV